MTTPPNSSLQFSEEQRTEVFRREVMAQPERQTKSLASIRGILLFFVILFLIGAAMTIAMVVIGSQSS